MTAEPKTRKSPAAATCINPKLIALAAKIDKAEAELSRALENLAPAEQNAWHNHEDKAAQAALKEARSAEDATCNASKKLGEKFSKIAVANLDELCLKARYADVWDEIGKSIIGDLLTLGAKPNA
jgi:phage I-like protein